MWAGGEFNFHEPKGYLGLKIGDLVKCVTTVPSIEVKKGGAMVFVDQLKKLSTERGLAITETRTHVFLPPVRTPRQTVAPSESPANTSTSQAFESSPDVSYTFIPTVSMLFRFSALTFNAHMIHLDPVFAREVDGHPERLVHGPLTSLLLLELASRLTPPGLGGLPAIKRYAYRAKHPIFVGRNLTLCGAYLPREATGGAITGTQLWAQNEQGTVCMTAEASFIVDV
ncbi:HotDog domain-containing protein [Cantharellus anzutake]|nr:HotDog domain-containing protein [Cantharellus anzutake]KAF8315499.1 HotDog domain-containing protein [Cantharellus anzutake]